MTMNKIILKKIDAANKEINRISEEDCINCAPDTASEIIFNHVDMDQFVFHSISADRYDHPAVYALITLLKSEKYAASVVKRFALYGQHVHAYNLIASALDTNQKVYFLDDQLLKSLRLIIEENRLSIKGLSIVVWEPSASIMVDNMVAAGVDPYTIVCSMDLVQLTAAGVALSKYGYKTLPDGVVPTYPMEPFNSFSYEKIIPLYECLSQLHGGYQAQVKLDAHLIGNSYIYLLPKDVDNLIKGDPVGFIEGACKNLNYFDRIVTRIVGAYRNGGELMTLDSLPKRLTTKLLKENILSIDDLNYMPKAANHHAREKLEHDMGV